MPSGGYRPGAGRPRKNPVDANLDGKPAAKRVPKPKVVKVDYPDVMDDFFEVAMKECGTAVPTAEVLRMELETYLTSRGCNGLVAPQTITDYVLNRQGFLACELMNRKIGRMTKDMKLSPYVTAAQGYYRAMQADFNQITQVINRHANTGPAETKNAFLELLQNRGF